MLSLRRIRYDRGRDRGADRDARVDRLADLQARRLGRLRASCQAPAYRYERARAGELVHVDVKKLGRISRPGHRVTGNWRGRVHDKGWECVHVLVDDATRIAYAEVLSDEHPETAVAFLGRAIHYLASLGIATQRVMTDNGNPYRSRAHAIACRELGLRHLRPRPTARRPTARPSVSSRR